MDKKQPFHEQVVVITGASAGIGKALALRLADQGAKLALAARRADRLEQVAADCRGRGAEAMAFPTDVSDEAQCKALIDQTVGVFNRVDMLVNNAGLAVVSLLEELPDLHLFEHVMKVNFYGMVYCTYYALPHLKQTRGRIVAISSLGGKMALPYNSAYAASKYALHGFYDALRMELAPHGVSVSVLCPYWVVTEFHEAVLDKHGTRRGAQGRAIYTRRMMTAERFAGIALKAAAQRKREVLMQPGPLGVWLKLLAPGFLDWFTIQAVLKPIIRRTKASGV